jgi:hypothetical protein
MWSSPGPADVGAQVLRGEASVAVPTMNDWTNAV